MTVILMTCMIADHTNVQHQQFMITADVAGLYGLQNVQTVHALAGTGNGIVHQVPVDQRRITGYMA